MSLKWINLLLDFGSFYSYWGTEGVSLLFLAPVSGGGGGGSAGGVQSSLFLGGRSKWFLEHFLGN